MSSLPEVFLDVEPVCHDQILIYHIFKYVRTEPVENIRNSLTTVLTSKQESLHTHPGPSAWSHIQELDNAKWLICRI